MSSSSMLLLSDALLSNTAQRAFEIDGRVGVAGVGVVVVVVLVVMVVEEEVVGVVVVVVVVIVVVDVWWRFQCGRAKCCRFAFDQCLWSRSCESR